MLEYEKYWNFIDLPFKVFPSGDTYFPSATHEEARARIFQAIRTRKRIILITGKPGSGKTTLWKRIKADLEKNNIPFAMGIAENPMESFSAIMREMGESMGLAPPRDGAELLGALRDKLRANVEQGTTNIWLIDECQVIKDPDIWERLRLLTNWSLNGSPALTLFLLGQPEVIPILREKEGFSQRIGAFYVLDALSLEETGAYIEYHLKKVNSANLNIFTEDAVHKIYQSSDGLPRNINHICDAALLLGAIQGKEFVDARMVETVAAERASLSGEDKIIWTPMKEGLVAANNSVGENSNVYENLVKTFDKFYYIKKGQNPIDLVEKELEPIVPQFIRAVKTDRGLMKKALYGEEPDVYLLQHCVNVAVQGVKIGVGMGYSEDELKQLSLAALIHDIGMGDIPEGIWTKKGSLSQSESDEMRRHPVYGHERLKPLDEIAKIVLQEHERMDGSGYPHGLASEDINELSYIIGAADIYDSLVHARPYRDKRYSSFEAIKEIVTKEKRRFPASVLKSLVAYFLFPVGSRVELNSREKAEVVEENRANPMRPIVKITHDQDNREYKKPRVIDLDRDQKFFIARSF
ncbi:MAG: HD domain-containing protein [Deltaproteobacteria bacterium]|nr:HD domain-containing protein [Deltaproteobacteria bacterium]